MNHGIEVKAQADRGVSGYSFIKVEDFDEIEHLERELQLPLL